VLVFRFFPDNVKQNPGGLPHGLSKTTLLDYPEHIAATVFTGGCNFRCPFCHNGELVLDPAGQPSVSEEEVLSYLKKRQGILQGVCVTGGEPTLQRDLRKFLQKIKELEYPIKLDTNGYMPGVLWELLQEHLIDYVAMDIKASRDNYARAAGLPHMDISRIEESIGILKSTGICGDDPKARSGVPGSDKNICRI